MRILAAGDREDRAGFGIGLVLICWVFFALTDTSVKWLVIAGIPAMQVAFFRYAVALALSLVEGVRRGVLFEWRGSRDMALVILRGGVLVLATAFNFIALKYLPLSVTSAIMNSAPILVTVLAIPLLGERVGPWRWGAVIVGFVGVLAVIRPFGADFHWASVLIVINAVAMAVFSILTRLLSGRISTQTMQVYMGAIGTAALLPFAVLTWTAPATLLDWGLLIGVGLWAWIGHEFFSRAHRYAEANVLTPFSYSFILYLTVSGYVVFGDVPDRMTLIGAAIIVVSGLVIWWREQGRARG